MVGKAKYLSSKEIKAVEEYRGLLLKKFPRRLRKIVLYGSKVRGDFGRSSDVDLLIVVTHNGKPVRRAIVDLTFEPIAKFSVLLSPIIMEEKEYLNDWSPFLSHVRKEGKTLWENKSS